jgi:hypothetical protein
MKTILATLAAATAIAALAAPAAAQPYGYDRGHDRYEGRHWNDGGRDGGRYGINARQARLEQRIEWGIRRGALTGREAREVRHDAYSIAHLERAYRSNGLSYRERQELDRRLDWAERRLEGRLNNNLYSHGYGHRR